MEKLLIGAFVVICLFALGCAAMQEQARLNSLTDEQVAEYNADPNNEDKIVCNEEKPIGSNIPKRTCTKQSDLDERTAQDQKAVEQMQRDAAVVPFGS